MFQKKRKFKENLFLSTALAVTLIFSTGQAALADFDTTKLAIDNVNEINLHDDATFTFYQGDPNEAYIIDASSPEAESVPSTTRLTGNIQIAGDNKKVTLSLRDADVKQVLRMFADKANMNIIFHNSARGEVTLDLKDVTLNTALEFVLDACELTYVRQDNTIIVVAKDSVKDLSYAKQNFITIPVKYVNAQFVADFLNDNMFNGNYQGVSATPNVAVNANKNELMIFGTEEDEKLAKKILAKLDVKPMVNVFPVNHITPAEMAGTLCDTILADNSDGEDGGSSSSNRDSNSTSSSDDEISLGGGYVQCTIGGDSSSSSSSRSSSSSDGITDYVSNPLTVAYFPEHGTVVTYGGSREQANMVRDFIKLHDKKQPMAYLELSMIELSEDGQKALEMSWKVWTPFGEYSFTGENVQALEPYSWYFIKGTSYTLVDDNWEEIHTYNKRHGWGPLVAQLSYLLKTGKARTLANPKILITNGQEATIDLTHDYLASISTEYLSSVSSGGSTTGNAAVTYNIGNDAGIKMTVTPFISPDGYVVLNMNPEYQTEIASTSTSDYTLLARRNLELKNVRVKDGETLVLAGMVDESESYEAAKIPILGELPIVGPLFRSSSTTSNKTEFVIMITPHIVYSKEQIENKRAKEENL